MNKRERELIFLRETVAHRCVMAVEYFNAVTVQKEEFWAFTQNCYGEIACLMWCHLFNNYDKDKLHYKNLFGNNALIHFGTEFSYGNIKKRLQKSINLSDKEYDVFRKEVVDCRNKFIAHKDVGSRVVFPDLDLARDMCLELRDIFRDLFIVADKKSPGNSDIRKYVEYYEGRSRDWLLRKCKNDFTAGIRNFKPPW